MREKVCGVYTITHIPTGEKYVGSSLDISKRWYQHRSKLALGKHPNKLLQKRWTEDGEQAFKFAIVEETDPEIVRVREVYYTELYFTQCNTYGFNSGDRKWRGKEKYVHLFDKAQESDNPTELAEILDLITEAYERLAPFECGGNLTKRKRGHSRRWEYLAIARRYLGKSMKYFYPDKSEIA